ncbi:TPA: hypothetical protein HA273_01345 [Candidatus Bathyarchaeota archaeon]|nr:hypothetical protein [Candidatus Bathyarchaeota archaeon]HIJ07745.1 hypothetical protein [Candidatus Bathyarchaeota archaeon]
MAGIVAAGLISRAISMGVSSLWSVDPQGKQGVQGSTGATGATDPLGPTGATYALLKIILSRI